MLNSKANKINNSYESEPSSGSGSSLSEGNDDLAFDVENMHLPTYLLKPMTEQDAAIRQQQQEPRQQRQHDTPSRLPQLSSQESSFEGFEEQGNPSKARMPSSQSYLCQVLSSQESPFKGFGDATKTKIGSSPIPMITAKQLRQELNKFTAGANIKPSPGQVTFPKYYDTILDENSCNAMDVPLPLGVAKASTSVSNGEDEGNPSSDLSFNGKIRSLNKKEEETEQQEDEEERCYKKEFSMINVSKLRESFVLKKYSNEKSPDLFGDDDSDEENNEAEAAAEPELGEVHDDNNGEDCGDNVNETRDPLHEEESKAAECSLNKSHSCPTDSSFMDEQTLDSSHTAKIASSNQELNFYRENCRREREILRRMRKSLVGVPPPPSVTIPQVDLFTMVLNKKEELLKFFEQEPAQKADEGKFQREMTVNSIFKPTHTLEEAKNMKWREILKVRQHGLCYNLTKASESHDYLSLAVIERFIGAETASSYKNSPSSAKKRNARVKMLMQSPGNRLSHLARRRAIFSSANLANTMQKVVGPQIVLNKNKRGKQRRKGTPKRMTPGSKKKNRKTPSSSARKRLVRSELLSKPGPSRETSKRALFQSPAKFEAEQKQRQAAATSAKPIIKPEIANRVEKSKRALLFSPDQQGVSQLPPLESLLLKRKRNPAEDDDDADSLEFANSQTNKLFRASSENLTPRALKIKSQSFCIGAGSTSTSSSLPFLSKGMSASTATASRSIPMGSAAVMSNSQRNFVGGSSVRESNLGCFSSSSLLVEGGSSSSKLLRAHSDMAAPSSYSLTDNQRKKLLWAVSQALQEKKITTKHEKFKEYAAVLTRVVRRIFQEYYHKNSTSNSETMLKLAKKYVFHVVQGKSVDQIYLQAKTQIEEEKRKQSTRRSGYIGPEEYQRLKSSRTSTASVKTGSVQNLFATENSTDSFNLSISQTSSVAFSLSSGIPLTQRSTQSLSFKGLISSQESALTQQSSCSSISMSQQQHLAIEPNPVLQLSSSKNNLTGIALRENVDCEQRRSAQKNFTGKDQRNVSPYVKITQVRGNGGSGLKHNSNPGQCFADVSLSGAKAKRQIVFDS